MQDRIEYLARRLDDQQLDSPNSAPEAVFPDIEHLVTLAALLRSAQELEFEELSAAKIRVRKRLFDAIV